MEEKGVYDSLRPFGLGRESSFAVSASLSNNFFSLGISKIESRCNNRNENQVFDKLSNGIIRFRKKE